MAMPLLAAIELVNRNPISIIVARPATCQVTDLRISLVVVYAGQCYPAFRQSQRVRSLTDHFDWLVREAVVDARDVPDYIGSLVGK